MSYFRPAKKQKLQESSSIILPSNIKTKKHNFSIEINSNSKNNSNKDTPSWIQYDLTQTNEQLDLFGNWKVGIKSCIISNSLSSWPKSTDSITSPTSSFVKLVVKFKDKESKIIGTKYFQNRVYSKDVTVSQINRYLSELWTNVCHTNIRGINIVGLVFQLTLFSFYLDKLTNSVHILSMGDSKKEINKKKWANFQTIFQAFSKTNDALESVEIFMSNELNIFLGGFQLLEVISKIEPTEKDRTTYDENRISLDVRCGLLPCDAYELHFEDTINIQNIRKMPRIGPSLINIYTSLPILRQTSSSKLYKGNTYQYLDQIPLKLVSKTFTSLIEHFPEKISYKKLTQNTNMESIEIILFDAENDKPINLGENFVLILDFQPMDF